MHKYYKNFWDWVIGLFENTFFENPFSEREKTEKILEKYSEKINSALIAIDWTNFTSNIKIINASNTNFSSVSFLEAGTDWVILTWLNDVKKEQFDNKNSVWIILWVADCAPVVWSINSGEIIFNLHIWYKWLFWDGKEDNLWIIYNFFEKIKELNIKTEYMQKVYIWPLAWSNFELPKDYFIEKSKYFFQYYKNLKIDDYFIENLENKEKWFLNLERLVYDTFLNHWMFRWQMESSWIYTTDSNNSWHSYRLFSKWWQKNSRLTATIWKNI